MLFEKKLNPIRDIICGGSSSECNYFFGRPLLSPYTYKFERVLWTRCVKIIHGRRGEGGKKSRKKRKERRRKKESVWFYLGPTSFAKS